MNVLVPIAILALIVGGSLYAYSALGPDPFSSQTDSRYASGSCRQLTEAEKSGLIDGFMKKDGYDTYDVVAVSEQNCSEGVGLYSANVEATINPNSPTEHRKTLRFQMRVTHNDTKIYEVVLANPAG